MIHRITDFFNDLWRLYEKGGPALGQSTGWPSLDVFYTIRPGEWTLVTGIPGHGKSSFVDNLIVNLAIQADWKWLVFSAENQPAVRHASNLAGIYIGRPFGPGTVRQRMSKEDWSYAGAFLDTQVAFIEPSPEDCTLDAILEQAAYEAALNKIRGLVIDPWNELDHSRPSSMTETEHISASLSKIRRFAKEYQVHVFVVAHPTKLIREKRTDGESNQYPVPTPWDVAGSAHWRNKADNCICVWRDVTDPRNETHIHVQKIRFREIGKVGLCRMYYDLPSGQFIDPLIGARKPFDPKTYHDELDAKINRHLLDIEVAQRELTAQQSREPGEEG